MRMLLPVLVVAIVAATAQPAAAAGNPSWSPSLTAGSGAGVAVRNGAAQIDQRTAFRAPLEDNAAEGTPDTAVPTGLLTLDPHRLASPTNRVAATVVARRTGGATATVDVRGLRATGTWTEWVPADGGTAVLPEPSRDIQARLVLTGDPGPVATGVTLTALASVRAEGARADERAAALPGLRHPRGASRRHHGERARDRAARPLRRAAVPSRAVAERQQRLLRPHLRPQRSLRVRARLGRRAVEHQGRLLEPQPRTVGRPAAGHTGGPGRLPQRLQRRQRRVPPQGGQPGGHRPRRRHLLGRPRADQQHHGHGGLPLDRHHPADEGRRHRPRVRRPAQDADVVGVAANNAGVPVECATDGWVRIGAGQYLPAAAVPDVGEVGPCASTSGTGQARDPSVAS